MLVFTCKFRSVCKAIDISEALANLSFKENI